MSPKPPPDCILPDTFPGSPRLRSLALVLPTLLLCVLTLGNAAEELELHGQEVCWRRHLRASHAYTHSMLLVKPALAEHGPASPHLKGHRGSEVPSPELTPAPALAQGIPRWEQRSWPSAHTSSCVEVVSGRLRQRGPPSPKPVPEPSASSENLLSLFTWASSSQKSWYSSGLSQPLFAALGLLEYEKSQAWQLGALCPTAAQPRASLSSLYEPSPEMGSASFLHCL